MLNNGWGHLNAFYSILKKGEIISSYHLYIHFHDNCHPSVEMAHIGIHQWIENYSCRMMIDENVHVLRNLLKKTNNLKVIEFVSKMRFTFISESCWFRGIQWSTSNIDSNRSIINTLKQMKKNQPLINRTFVQEIFVSIIYRSIQCNGTT